MSATPEQPSTGDTTCPYPSAHTHVVTATVLESFRTGDLAAFCQERGIVPEELLAWRTAFVAAGVAGLHEALHPGGWLQVNLQLDPFGVSWTELISDDFQEHIRAWLEEGHIDRFFYLHKPPGVRLRFRGARARFLPLLEGRLTTLMRKGVVAGSDIVPYDAEVYQFGGAAGLELAHEYFTYESLAVLAYHRLRLQGAVVLPPAEFSLVLVDTVLRALTDDAWELWDVWCKFELTGRLPLPAGAAATARDAAGAAGRAFLPLLRSPETTLQLVSDGEGEILRRYRQDLTGVVARTRRARDEGALLWGLREILPFWVIFHWNRMGFDLDRQQYLAFFMSQLLNPKKGSIPCD